MRTTAATDGVLLVDKPGGMTSHDVVAVARRALDTRRIGHTGTLDPFANGLHVLLVGKATRLLPYVDGEPKIYQASIRFGLETTTDDCTGEAVADAAYPSVGAVDDAIRALTGVILQRPPDYSAKKLGGTRAYAAARSGTPLLLEPARVTVHTWKIIRRDESRLDALITCSGGTYVRALARDLGRLSGSVAHLSTLRRTRNGVFDVGNAVSVDTLRSGGARLDSIRSAIPHVTTQLLEAAELQRVQHGNVVDARVDALIVALVDANDEVVALAKREEAVLRPRVVLRDA